jgi:nitrogen fixation NifU-like protein
MEKSFDQWAQELQELILEQDRKIFSPKVIENYLKPLNLREIPEPDGVAVVTGPCGDTMYFALKIQKDSIAEVGFLTDGCGPTISCGSMLTQLVFGRTIGEAAAIEQEDLLEALGGLPVSHEHCAKLAIDTLRRALKDSKKQGGQLNAKR